MSFAREVRVFARKAKIRGEKAQRFVGLTTLTKVVLKSPVREGRFRGNWRLAVNRVDATFDLKTKDVRGFKTIERGLGRLGKAKWTDEIHISNNVPYAKRLEDGHSKQAPQGVVKTTLVEMRAEIGRLVR